MGKHQFNKLISGHIVAKVAEDKLTSVNPTALKKAYQLLDVYKKAYPSEIKSEKDHAFVECSTFADEIKGQGQTW